MNRKEAKLLIITGLNPSNKDCRLYSANLAQLFVFWSPIDFVVNLDSHQLGISFTCLASISSPASAMMLMSAKYVFRCSSRCALAIISLTKPNSVRYIKGYTKIQHNEITAFLSKLHSKRVQRTMAYRNTSVLINNQLEKNGKSRASTFWLVKEWPVIIITSLVK